jgi:hypothetical protein
MNALTLTNGTGRRLTLIVEPVADEYAFGPGDKIELRPPLYIDRREIIDIQITDDHVVVLVPEEVDIRRDGVPVSRLGV